MPQSQDIYFLLSQYLSGQLEKKNLSRVKGWIQENPEEFKRLSALWQQSAVRPERYTKSEAKKRLNQRIDAFESEDKLTVHKRRYRGLAASVVIALCLSMLVTYLMKYPPFENSDNEVSWIEKHTANSQVASFKLYDGTKITLNAGSSLRYPKNMPHEKQREVWLSGEAYFKVDHNPEKPFIVHTNRVNTKVLGTSFLVNAYPSDNQTKVSVISGKVAVGKANETSSNILLPEKQLLFDHRLETWTLQDASLRTDMAWMEGKLAFKDQTLDEVARLLERHFDVRVNLGNEELNRCRITADFGKNTLHEVMDAICYINNLEYTYQNKEVTINGKGCLTENKTL